MAPPARCRRPRQHQAPVPQAAIWITDLMLRRAIAQYQRRSLVSNRTLSSHRGPLECRRRPLGKRHMTGIMASPTPYRPTWWFELMGNKNTWQWEPPTTSRTRRDKESTMSLPGLVDKFIKWLEASDLDKPFLQPPADLAAEQSAAVAQPARQLTEEYSHVDGILADLTQLRTAILQLDHVTHENYIPLYSQFRLALEDRVERGDYLVKDIRAAMAFFDTAVTDRLSHAQARFLSYGITRTLMRSIAALRRNDVDGTHEEAWAAVVDRIFSFEKGVCKYRLFRALMLEASAADVRRIESTMHVQMIQEFVSSQASESAARADSGWLCRTAALAHALENLPEMMSDGILQCAKDCIWDATGSTERIRQLRFSWLVLVAHLRHSHPASIAAATHEFVHSCGPLTARELWQLSSARLMSGRVLDRETYRSLVRRRYKSASEPWTKLAVAVVDSNRPDGLRDFWSWLGDIGQTFRFVRCLVSSAFGSNEGGARRVLQRMATDPQMPHPSLMWEMDRHGQSLLGREWSSLTQEERNARIRSMKDLMNNMAHWHVMAPHLSDRQAQRGVEWCMRIHHRVTGGQSSSAILASLAQVLVRDLQRGEWGRTTRLEWLVKKLSQHQGEEQAAKALVTLKGWRRMLVENQRRH